MIERLEAQIFARQSLIGILRRETALAFATALNTWFVYFLVDTETRKVKIGYTNNLRRRYLEIHGMNSGKLVIFHYELHPDEKAALARETELHHQFAAYRDFSPSHYDRKAGDREWYLVEGELKAYMQRVYRHKQRMYQLRFGKSTSAEGDT